MRRSSDSSDAVHTGFRGVKLRVPPETSECFYRSALGMQVVGSHEGQMQLAFKRQMHHQFLELDVIPCLPAEDDGGIYWKCGVMSPDITGLANHLLRSGFHFGRPGQFRDIGYLCHGSDSSGMTTELLQHTFERSFRPLSEPKRAVTDATLGQLTIRTSDIDKTLQFYTEGLGWDILSHQAAQRFGLYFLAGKDVCVSVPKDVDAVTMRESLWQQPFMTLEIKYDLEPVKRVLRYSAPEPEEAGFLGMVVYYQTGSLQALLAQLRAAGGDVPSPFAGHVFDPSGIPIYLREQSGPIFRSECELTSLSPGSGGRTD